MAQSPNVQIRSDAGAYAQTTRLDEANSPSSVNAPLDPTGKTRDWLYSDKHPGMVALTFDDGPDPVYTPQVLDILKRRGITATFFVNGKNVQAYPELVRRIVNEGHTLGNHTQDHARLTDFKDQADKIRAQIDDTQTVVNEALGKPYPMRQFRPPFGAYNGKVRRVFKEKALDMVLWSVDSGDWRTTTEKKLLANVFDGPKGVLAVGGIVLFHDKLPLTVEVLDKVIQRFEDEKLEITTSDALLKAKYGWQPAAREVAAFKLNHGRAPSFLTSTHIRNEPSPNDIKRSA